MQAQVLSGQVEPGQGGLRREEIGAAVFTDAIGGAAGLITPAGARALII